MNLLQIIIRMHNDCGLFRKISITTYIKFKNVQNIEN